jgi:hypothetical protein
MFSWAILLESAFLLALGGAVLALIHWKDRKKRLPFTQKILRPPGESLRLRLIELDERLNDRVMQLFLAAYSPLIMAGQWRSRERTTWTGCPKGERVGTNESIEARSFL